MADTAWARLAAVMGSAALGLGGAYLILSQDAPRALVAVSGVLLVVGVAATLILLAFTYVVIVEEVRPRIVARSPRQPLALSTELGALKGTRRFSLHRVRFWAGLTLNSSFFVGFMIFRRHEEVTFPVQPEPRP
jgi:hypothetical protein